LTQGVERYSIERSFDYDVERVMELNLIDMTEMLRPFFWLMVAIAALAPVAIAVARRFAPPAS
jgi:hypothetical protein